MDGHTFAQIADDPLMQHTVAAYHGDETNAAYRASRPMMGWIYFVTSLGGQRVLLAPSMNAVRWGQPSTRRNVETLRGDGFAWVGPDDGWQACRTTGTGRMAEPERILAEIRMFSMSGRRMLCRMLFRTLFRKSRRGVAMESAIRERITAIVR